MSTDPGSNPWPDDRTGDKRRRDFGIIGRAQERAAAAFVSRLSLEGGERLLDVGCGTGNVSIMAARAGADVTGVDSREPFLSRGRAWAKNERLLIRFKRARPEKLPFSDGNFHVVVNFLGLPFCDDPAVAVAQMQRVCRQRGRLALTAWDPDSPLARIIRLAFQYSGVERLARALELGAPDSLQRLLHDCGPPEISASHQASLHFRLSAPEIADCFLQFYPPTREAGSALDAEARKALAEELAADISASAVKSNSGLELSSTYHELHFRNP